MCLSCPPRLVPYSSSPQQGPRNRRSTGATKCPPAGPASGRPSCRRCRADGATRGRCRRCSCIEFITALKAKTENLHVVNMFTSPLRKAAPAMVLAEPARHVAAAGARVRKAGRVPVRQHPSAGVRGRRGAAHGRARSRGRASARSCSRTRSSSSRRSSTSTAPTRSSPRTASLGSETPHIFGMRENVAGPRPQSRCREARDRRSQRHVPAAERVGSGAAARRPSDEPRQPRLREHLRHDDRAGGRAGSARLHARHAVSRRARHGAEANSGSRCSRTRCSTPGRGHRPAWSHDRAAWTVEAKFIVNDYGLRNRLAIITETPGQPTFERRIYAQYAYIMALLEYTNAHAKEIQAVVKAADDETVADVQAGAESGSSRNWLDGEYRSRGKIDVLGVPDQRRRVPAGHELHGHAAGHGVGTAGDRATWTTSRSRSGTRDASCRADTSFPQSWRHRREAARAQRPRHDARQADARRGRGVRDQADAQDPQRRLRHDHARRRVLERSTRASFPPARSTWTWRSRWRTRRSTTSSRRRATASSAGACSMRNCAHSRRQPGAKVYPVFKVRREAARIPHP